MPGSSGNLGSRRSAHHAHSLHPLKRDALAIKQALLRGRVLRMADILDRFWLASQGTAPGVSTARIAQVLQRGLAAGLGGGRARAVKLTHRGAQGWSA